MPCILLADHDGTTRNFLAKKLEEAGYEVDQAENGHEAIIRLSIRRHELVISCFEMRGKNGLEFLREMRRLPEYDHIPFVLFTEVDPKTKTDSKTYMSLIHEVESLGAVYLPRTARNFRQFPIGYIEERLRQAQAYYA
jgi:two-component system chemotaxis response regulator CheY